MRSNEEREDHRRRKRQEQKVVSFVPDMVQGPNGWLRLHLLLAAAQGSLLDLLDTHQLKRACWATVCEGCDMIEVLTWMLGFLEREVQSYNRDGLWCRPAIRISRPRVEVERQSALTAGSA